MSRPLGLLLLLIACAQRQVTPPASETTGNVGGDGSAIALERTACFGDCPVYRISVSPEGLISYEGRAHVRQLGRASAQIPAERVNALLSELENAGYFSLAARYTSAEPVCGRYSADSPSAITSVQLGNRSKRIEHDHGCGAVPRALAVLEQRIDEVLGSARWTGP
jgi:hypothetical protein